MNDHVYSHNDVYTLAGKTTAYLASLTLASDEDSPNQPQELVGNFAVLPLAGRWPRAVNLWEGEWPGLVTNLEEQHRGGLEDRGPDFDEWVRRSVSERSGGFNRFLLPGPDSPDLASIRPQPGDDGRPCVVQLDVQIREGAADDYLAWFSTECVPAAKVGDWRALMWLSCLHSSEAFVFFASRSWDHLDELTASLPAPDPAWQAEVHTSLLEAAAHSRYLRPPIA